MTMKKLYLHSAVTSGIFFLLAPAASAQNLTEDLAEESQHPLSNHFAALLERSIDSSLSFTIWSLAAIAIVAITLYLRNRDTPGNNIRRARMLHKKGLVSHERGDAEAASEYYVRAAAFREKVEGQE